MSEDRRIPTAQPETDALREEDALAECGLVDLVIDPICSRCVMIFDAKGALHIRHANTCLVVIHGVSVISWRSERVVPSPHWPRVTRWTPALTADGWSVVLGLATGAAVELAGSHAEYYEGDVPGMDDPPPDLTTATPADVLAGFARTASPFEVTASSIIPPGRMSRARTSPSQTPRSG